MRMINTKSGLLRALGLLKEEQDTDEIKKQRKMSNAAIKIRSISEEEDEEKEGGEDAGDDLFSDTPDEGGDEGGEEGGEESSGEEESGDAEGGGEEDADTDAEAEDKPEKPKELPGAAELKKTPAKLPDTVTGLSVIDRVNKIRAGSSMKDDKVMKAIDNYVTSLTDNQAKDMFTYLDALARMILAGMDPSEVPVPSGMKADVKKKTSEPVAPQKKQQKASADLPIVSPVMVGEGVKRRLKEVDVPVRNGKLVPFGSRSHIADIEMRIEDLERIRSYQENGSDSKHVLGLAIRALKNQLRAAQRSAMGGNPRTQPLPPIVEKEK